MNGLLLDTNLSDEQRNYAEIVHSSGEAMLALINDILDFSKIEAKKLDLETLDFDLSGLLEDFTASLVLQAHGKGLELLCRVDLEVPELLRGDPGRLRQILANLTDNAIKFTPAGEVEVRVSLLEDAGQHVLLRFSVRDTGVGIANNKTGMLFEKFSQVDASTTRQYGGTGLGLAISKHLAEMMEGEIGVTSEEGQGSEFWFTARLGRQACGLEAMPSSPGNLHGVRVLIVDDNATHRDILSTRLASWEMRPGEVPTAARALEALDQALAEHDPFHLLLIDMQMPGMDGAELGRMVRAQARWANIQMVILTSLGAGDNPQDFEEIGFAAYVTKPIGHQELKTILSRVIDSTSAKDSKPQSILMRRVARETLQPFQDRKWRILLAEDNITNQQVALNILRKLGLRADAVANGAEALKVLETIPYDLVLMDVQMPEMDGFEATRRIRSSRSAVRNPKVPIIAMTANAMQGDREKCLEVEMDDYVPKPISPQSLAEVLKKWLPRENSDESPQPGRLKIPSGSGPQSNAPQVFDRAAMLVRLMNDEPLMRTVVEAFLLDIPRQISALKEYMDKGDISSVVRQAHTIKGASANVGGDRLRDMAYGIEQAAHLGDLLVAARSLPALEAEFETLKRAMTQQA
jgi:CheY-like chemotaxis protein/HPt (histidine-containing phosphotransfer) domain-containing protein